MKNLKRKNSLFAGFTLVELLVVISIIGLLSALSMAGVTIARNKAKVAKAQNDIDQLYKAIASLANDTGYWPGLQEVDMASTTDTDRAICGDGCAIGIASSSAGIMSTDGTYSGWSGPYMRSIPRDGWGNEYFFDTSYSINGLREPCNGGGSCSWAAVVGSYGPDGVGNNQYNADDIIKVIIVE